MLACCLCWDLLRGACFDPADLDLGERVRVQQIDAAQRLSGTADDEVIDFSPLQLPTVRPPARGYLWAIQAQGIGAGEPLRLVLDSGA